jgi:hypothetical protein
VNATRHDEYGDDWLRVQVELVERQLVAEFGDRVAPDVIADAVERGYVRFVDAPVRPFLPMLVGRHARHEVRARVRGLHQAA